MIFKQLPIVIRPESLRHLYPEVYYPVASSIRDESLQMNLNTLLNEATIELVKQQHQEQETSHFDEMINTFALKTNEKEIISVTNTNYAIFPQAAHGLTLMNARTIDLRTEKIYSLSELFKAGSSYIEVLSHHVQEQIKQRAIPVFEPFTTIDPDQAFYIADKCLVLFFPIYAITPYYFGIPFFPISLYDLEPILKEDIFVQRLLENN